MQFLLHFFLEGKTFILPEKLRPLDPTCFGFRLKGKMYHTNRCELSYFSHSSALILSLKVTVHQTLYQRLKCGCRRHSAFGKSGEFFPLPVLCIWNVQNAH